MTAYSALPWRRAVEWVKWRRPRSFGGRLSCRDNAIKLWPAKVQNVKTIASTIPRTWRKIQNAKAGVIWGRMWEDIREIQSLAGQTPKYLASDIQLIADTGRPQLRSASERCRSMHTHTTVSATEVSLLPILVCGTPCRHICNRTWTIQTFQAVTERTRDQAAIVNNNVAWLLLFRDALKARSLTYLKGKKTEERVEWMGGLVYGAAFLCRLRQIKFLTNYINSWIYANLWNTDARNDDSRAN